MSGRILTFKNYLGGSDNVQMLEMFPSTQTKFTYQYGADVSTFTFDADYQTIVVDKLSYDRVSGDPNFADSTVIGSFGSNTTIGSAFINTQRDIYGDIDLTIPAQRYTGPLLPDARTNVPITVVSFKWTQPAANIYDQPQTLSHRWAVIERYEPDVTIGNPTLDPAFNPIPTS